MGRPGTKSLGETSQESGVFMMENNEQWKGGGDCGKCRRAKYCKKKCRAAREREAHIMREIIRGTTGINEIEAALNQGK